MLRLWRKSAHGFGLPHDRLSSGAGSAVALPCRVLHSLEGIGLWMFRTFCWETWGFDICCYGERGEILPALDCDPECLAPCPPSGFFGDRGGHSPISRGGTMIGSLLSDLPGPVSSPGSPGRCCCSPAVLRGPGHAHRQAYSSHLSSVAQFGRDRFVNV